MNSDNTEDGVPPCTNEELLALVRSAVSPSNDQKDDATKRLKEALDGYRDAFEHPTLYDDAIARSKVEGLFKELLNENERLRNQTPSDGDDVFAADFWATVARDKHGFVRTQDEWDTLAAYARNLQEQVTPDKKEK